MKRILPLLLLALLAFFILFSFNNKGVVIKDNPRKTTLSLKKCGLSKLPQDCLLYQLSLNGQINGFNSSIIYLNSIKERGEIALICHNLSHQLGYKAFDYYQELNFINKNTISGCEGGFIHGIFEEAAKRSFKLKNAFTYCQHLPIENDCSHALGHYYYSYLHGVSSDSIKGCTSYTHPKDCLDGLFMARSLNSQNNNLQILRSCSQYDIIVASPCIRNAFYGLGKDTLSNSGIKKPSTLCSFENLLLEIACYEGIGYGSRSMLADSLDPADYARLCQSDRSLLTDSCLSYVLKQNKDIKGASFAIAICDKMASTNDNCPLKRYRN